MTHYGGTFTKSGRLSATPERGLQFNVAVFLERLVRFDIAKANGTSLLTDIEISRVLGKSVRAIQSWRRRVPYLKKRMELLTGIHTDSSNAVELTTSRHKQMLGLMLPNALRTLYDALQTPTTVLTTLAEKKFRVEVAKDILDRQGDFPRISRTDAHVKNEHSFSSLDGVSKDLLDSIDVPFQDDEAETSILIKNKIAASKAFSQTETLTPQDMEASMLSLETMQVEGKIQ